MNKEHYDTMAKFITNVQAYRETLENAKAATKGCDHSKSRRLHNDAQIIGESIDKQISAVKQILSSDQMSLL